MSNSGDCNLGDCNSGDMNSGDCNSGFFNVDEPNVRMFGKDTNFKKGAINFPKYFYLSLTEWISENDMSKEEKKENLNYKTTSGYLKVYAYKDAWKKSFENNCDKAQAEQTVNLPNFDYNIFEEITGITKELLDTKRGLAYEDKLNSYKDIKLEDLSQESLIKIIKKLGDKK